MTAETAATRLIRYPETRALEDAAFTRGVTPTRLFPMLLPLWCVEIEAEVREAEDYWLIDRFIELGIARAGLDNAADLARFLSLDETLVDRALRVLSRIGHITGDSAGRVALTPIGHESVRDGKRYVRTQRDRRRLYFDAFGSRPLTRPYYDSSRVGLLSPQDVMEVAARRDGPAFRPVYSLRMFSDRALADLAALRDRDRFNLPERVESPARVGDPEPLHLPVYLVRAVEGTGRTRYLAYTQAADTADEDVTAICEHSPEIAGVVEAEEADARGGRDERRVREWLRRRGLEESCLARTAEGMLRVTLPAAAFGDGDGGLPPGRLGTFTVLGNDFFHVWCPDEGLRRGVLLDRAGSYVGSRARPDAGDVAARLGSFGVQLGFGRVGTAAVRRMAADAGRRDLARLLDGL
ncbi:hypothetical protein AGRA3207_001006 [Actinomadura graeca]|uniref:Winged helix DNA-binding domain-containing protein n=1 Tax=Actinomadura graeca TaxID=2750812 RepID=A0ABX8QNF7_9ACTN|nr:hypothetical protein [Actinomadura graeca]QXJ20315.1 hypothetical protein AGRA3207_001006 [Actinomadura graeca]